MLTPPPPASVHPLCSTLHVILQRISPLSVNSIRAGLARTCYTLQLIPLIPCAASVQELKITDCLDEAERDLRNLIAQTFLAQKRAAEEEAFAEAVFFDPDEDQEIKRARNTWARPWKNNRHGRPDYESSTLARILRDGDLLNPESSVSKLFRTRFRVPYPVFLKIVQWAKDAFDTSAKDCTGRRGIPMELKV